MFILGVIFVTLEAVCDLLQPRLMSLLVDEGAVKGSFPEVWLYGGMMLGVAVLGLVFALSRNYIATNVSQRFGAELRLDIFEKIQSLSVDGLDSFEEGSLITRQINDVTQVQNFVAGLMRIVVRAPVVCVGAIVMAVTLDLRMIPIIVPIVAILVIIITICMKIAYPRFAIVQGALDKLNTVVREYLAGIRLVKAFRRFQSERDRFGRVNTGLTDATVAANRMLVIMSPLMVFFINLGIAAILWLGAQWVDFGDMQVGQIMALLSYMTQILMSINIISNILNIFVRVRASHRRIGEVFEMDAPHPCSAHGDNTEQSFITITPPHIEFSGVSMAYRNSTGEPALTGVSFALNKGETLGIIGPTGSGKTTLASLLLRFYEPTAGQIILDGVPLSDIDEAHMRSIIAIVPQTPTLFSGTIRENIAWGKPGATDEEILQAARDAQALDFIKASEQGFMREIGQSGAGLSGGQKQRISIARALLRQPELLILDDCTSALDVITETAVKNALGSYKMTTLFITQRVMTVRGCDKILVLENGECAGFGTHEDLFAASDVYRDIYASQVGDARN